MSGSEHPSATLPEEQVSFCSTRFGTSSTAVYVRAGRGEVVKTMKVFCSAMLGASLILLCVNLGSGRSLQVQRHSKKITKELFQTSDRCFACHNGLSTPAGEDISIGSSWRASMMANSARDPYWQAAVRRESIDHPES